MPQRWLKPGLRTSEKWNSVSFEAQSLYIRLISLVDDYGRYDARPAVLAGECFAVWNDQNPSKAISVNMVSALCQQLADMKLIDIYETIPPKPKRFLQLTNWSERTRTESRWPDPSKCQQRADTVSAQCPPPPPSPSPSPSPTPSVKSVSVGFSNGNNLEFLRNELYQLFNRPKGAAISTDHLEQSLLAEVSRRPDFKTELKLIKEYRRQEPRYFPQSVCRVLETWDVVLDKSRNKTPAPKSHEELRTKEVKGIVETAVKQIQDYETR